MSLEVFTAPWAAALGEELKRSKSYRRAAADWEGALVLALTGAGDERAVYLDLAGGECREARLATASELATAPVVLSAKAKVWKRILAGKFDPVFGLVAGKLKLVRGSLGTLMKFADASKELVAAARRIDAHFP